MRNDNGSVQATAARRPKSGSVPGGKALARLEQFRLERGLPLEPVGTKKRRTAPTASRAAARRAPDEVGPDYLDAFRRLHAMSPASAPTAAAPATAVPVAWRSLGPYAVPHGQTYGGGPGSRPSVSGRISAVAIDPGNSSHILIGAAGGGIWETRDAGVTWEPRTDDQPSLAMGAIAFNPSNPQVVYAGTGEGDFYSRLGTGFLTSTDGGTTWTINAVPAFQKNGFYDLAVDPLDGNHILAALTNGLYESRDGGATWTRRRPARTWDLSMHPAVAGDPNSTAEVFAACSDGLFRSTNGGTTWSSVPLPGSSGGISRIEVCHAPSDGSIAYVHASIGNSAYLARRETFGGSFAAITGPANLAIGQAWYDWCAAVAPNNPDILYVGGIEIHKGTRSSIGTWSWQTISARTVGDSIHPDQHHIAISAAEPNTICIGNDGGLYRSVDAGVTWKSLNKGLCIIEFEYLAQHPQHDAWLLGGTQDNGTVRFEGQPVWYHIQDGDGGDCAINDATPLTCFHSFYGMGLERSTTGGGWGSWSWLNLPLPAGHQALFYPPMEARDSLVVQAGSSLIISRDAGASWVAVGLPAGVASALSAPSGTRIYAGTTQGHVYRTDLVGTTWGAPVALTRPASSGYVSDLLADPTNMNRLWCTYSSVSGGSFVHRSDDGGNTWTDVGVALPPIPINAIEIDPTSPDTVFVAADVGVYRSNDAGVNWMPFANGLPNCLAKDLLLHAPSRLLRVATQNRGAWEIPIDSAAIPEVQVYLRDSDVDTGRTTPSPSGVPNPFVAGSLTHWFQCADIKLDAPPYQHASTAEVDFELFEDDHGIFASGLQHENAQRNRVSRVFVQVHNRGVATASNVIVKAFFADASVGLPDLPATFWNNFPNNVIPAGSPWQAVASHQTIGSLEAGRSRIVAFDWPVPATAADHTCLLAIISADNDTLSTGELNIAQLVLNNKKCGLKNLSVVNPPPSISPFFRLVRLNLWASGGKKRYRLTLDRKPGSTVRGVILSNRLAKHAKENDLKPIKLSTRESEELARLVKRFPHLQNQLSPRNAYQIPSAGTILRRCDLRQNSPDPLVVIVAEKQQPGRWSLLQLDDSGQIVGGFTLAATAAQVSQDTDEESDTAKAPEEKRKSRSSRSDAGKRRRLDRGKHRR